MTSWMNWELADDVGENPIGVPAEFEFSIEYDFDPGDTYTCNKNKYPDYPATVTLTKATCKKICAEYGQPRLPTQNEIDDLTQWFWSVLDKNQEIRDQIETFGLEQMSFAAELMMDD